MTGLTKQAKVLTEPQIKAALAAVASRPTALRDRVMILASTKAGLRAKEIAALEWPMVTGSDGALGTALALPNTAAKGKRGGRTIPLHGDLCAALADLRVQSNGQEGRMLQDARGRPLTANGVAVWFGRLYRSLGFTGASSHSGRRTFITQAARKITAAGGSLRDVQQLAGHASLTETTRYIDASEDAKRRVIGLI